ncbi:hypothetical protein Syun_017227 [Stephania yunnanensis]|uniref:HNH nuclease domain-containing protein n=1 Tax=Stephania yunnanensis TaxID=152371 RepID=A0AAP0J850_9MAGN
MAQLTCQGVTKLPFNGDRSLLFGFESKDPFLCNHGLGLKLMPRKNRVKNRVLYCGVGKKSGSFRQEERMGVSDCEEDEFGYEDNDDDDDDDDGFERDDELSSFRGLVLDISYRPVNVVCWKRAICLEFMEKVRLLADVLEYYGQTVNSSNGSFYIPAVLRVPHLLQVVKRRRIKQNLSRKSIFFRDMFTCQYCCSRENLTIDHVLPISRGGEWKWENLVTACSKCNSRKGQKTLEEANMKLIKAPKTPKDFDILAIPLTTAAIKTLRSKKSLPDEWRQYLGKLPAEI